MTTVDVVFAPFPDLDCLVGITCALIGVPANIDGMFGRYCTQCHTGIVNY